MIASPKNFIEQFQNFIEHIAGLMKTFLTKEVADNYYLSITEQILTSKQKSQVWTNIGLGNSSETVSGVIQIATNSDVQTGTNNTKALSPLKAFTNFVSLNAQTLSETIQTQVLTNLGVIDALEDLITEYGGTVPTSLSDTNTANAQSAGDLWTDLS